MKEQSNFPVLGASLLYIPRNYYMIGSTLTYLSNPLTVKPLTKETQSLAYAIKE